MSQNRLRLITLGILLSIFLASVEGTIVSTAMPTIVSQLGGLSIYSWVFAMYMLTSTTTVPIYGKLSDVFGRKQVFLVAMVLFLAGSVLCGLATSMEQLIFFRAVQGIGAGGVLPLTFTIIGDLFSFEQRARMQGLFSGVWGVSSIIGPLIGGFLVDPDSWQWVFYINLLPGVIAMALVWFPWKDSASRKSTMPAIDVAGAGLLTIGIICLLLGLDELGQARGVLLWGHPPSFLGRWRGWTPGSRPDLTLSGFSATGCLLSPSCTESFLAGRMFGSLTYVPLFVQAVLGTSATQPGCTFPVQFTGLDFCQHPCWLPVIKGWLSFAGFDRHGTAGSRRILHDADWDTHELWVAHVLPGDHGIGDGMSLPGVLDRGAERCAEKRPGQATSTLQFSRSIGGTLGVSVLGVALTSKLASRMAALGKSTQVVFPLTTCWSDIPGKRRLHKANS